MTFQCPYAEKGRSRCPEWRCDCFIETHPDSPFDLHPEAFVVAPAPLTAPRSADGPVPRVPGPSSDGEAPQ